MGKPARYPLDAPAGAAEGGLTMSLGDLAGLLWIGAWFTVMWRLRYYDGMLDQLLQELREELIQKK